MFIKLLFMLDYECNISISRDYLLIRSILTVLDTSLIIISDWVQIGMNISIITTSHDTSILSQWKFAEFGRPIFIKDDC
ncbi:uncharacterized protein P174DRAFT_498296 [Aspergillus novofumigatus IBT 16806]|uniref:Uncharacterized protein n=1 Tax=Aspergillus novofumigatus (strain IBT 16806) TaxID=1392255 RepID=A0A2I1BWF3_ASPN1|nr:uncharacterized protein P174DRAFT_498296 [Aspergillus novofumigatus IBT 16806]PKX89709.1 hypothetical protein P174DRAFT_498296 [Aspergillus novofumigatus IBT 16806]